MEESIKGTTSGKVHLGVTESLGAFYQRVIKISLQNTLPYEMLKYGLPYEASRTYRTMKIEFEHNRCEAMMNAHQARTRGL